MSKQEIKQVKPQDLIPYAKNSRTHTDVQIKQVMRSIEEFGFTNPILLHKNTILAGHCRVEAAKRLGIKTVPCLSLDHLTSDQARAYVIADNKLAMNAGWNDDVLKQEIEDLLKSDFDISLIGFDTSEFKDLGVESFAPEFSGDPDDVPAVPQNIHGVTRGEVWQLGEHRLMCGDSTDADDVGSLMNGNIAVFCFTSPPYSDQREYNGGKDLSTQKLAMFLHAPCDLFAVNLGIQRKNGSINQYWDDYIKAASDYDLDFLSWNVWDKGEAGSIGNQSAMFAITHEWIFVFGSKKQLNRTVPNKSAGHLANHTSNRQADGSIKKSKDSIVRKFSQLQTVYKCTPEKARDDIDHPARFPVAFPQGYIEACSNSGDIVLEPFGGSGSTLIACEKTGRKCYMMELDEHYCSVIIERWQQFTGKKAAKIA